jgi:hypothetical protein
MDWDVIMKVVEVVIIPITAFLIREIQKAQKDLVEFKLHVAQNYATSAHLMRLEVKIDELKDLLMRCRLEE